MQLQDNEDVKKYIEKWTNALRAYQRAKMKVSDEELEALQLFTSVTISKRFTRWVRRYTHSPAPPRDIYAGGYHEGPHGRRVRLKARRHSDNRCSQP